MRKRILTMTVAAVTVIAAMTGCNKKDAGSVETTKQDVETTTVAETTTEVETTTEAETTTEYSYENDPYFDMENSVEVNMGYNGILRYCLIDGDTYVAITGAECIAEDVQIAEEYTNFGHSAYSAIRYRGHNNIMYMSIDDLHGSDGFKPTSIK